MEQLDQDAVNLAKAIRQVETGNKAVAGGSGELQSRYQFMPRTWKAAAGKVLGDANAPLTLENENKVAYTRIKQWKDQGYAPDQIASLWNHGKPDYAGVVGTNAQGVHYDTPAYVGKVKTEYQKIKGSTAPSPVAPAEQPAVGGYKPTVEAKTGEGMLAAGGKALINLPGSAINFAKGALQQFNPLEIAKNVGQFASGLGDLAKEKGGYGAALGSVAKELPGAAYKTLVPQAAQQLISGDTIAAQKTLTEDPFGQAAPLVLAAEGGAKALGKEPAFSVAVSKTGDVATKPLRTIGSGVGKMAEYGVSQATALNPETVRTIISDPKGFAAADAAGDTRLTTAAKVKAGLDASIEDLGDTGKEYQTIRQGKKPVTLSPTTVTDVFKKYGVEISPEGKITTTAESVPLSPGDAMAVQHFVDQYGPGKVNTANAFLNARKALDNLSSWDAAKTDASDKISRDLRKAYDTQGKAQIKGLSELDKKYSPMVRELKQLKKDYLQADGSLKEGAINKIANLLGPGKEPILARLESVSPGITSDIKIVKALEDVEKARGQKAGAYNRVAGAVLGGAAGGGVGAILGAILTSPQVAVYLLEKYGRAAGVGDQIVRNIKSKLASGTKLNTFESRAFMTILGTASQQEELSNRSARTGSNQGSPQTAQ